jgi:hypothetical protein
VAFWRSLIDSITWSHLYHLTLYIYSYFQIKHIHSQISWLCNTGHFRGKICEHEQKPLFLIGQIGKRVTLSICQDMQILTTVVTIVCYFKGLCNNYTVDNGYVICPCINQIMNVMSILCTYWNNSNNGATIVLPTYNCIKRHCPCYDKRWLTSHRRIAFQCHSCLAAMKTHRAPYLLMEFHKTGVDLQDYFIFVQKVRVIYSNT